MRECDQTSKIYDADHFNKRFEQSKLFIAHAGGNVGAATLERYRCIPEPFPRPPKQNAMMPAMMPGWNMAPEPKEETKAYASSVSEMHFNLSFLPLCPNYSSCPLHPHSLSLDTCSLA